jgi:glycerate dehydrogenase
MHRWSCSIDQSRHHLDTNHQIITATMTASHHIIALDSWVKLPEFDFPHSLDIITDGSALTRPEQLKDATIAIDSQVPVNAALLDHMPKLRLLAATGTGVDHIDNKALQARGIVLCKVPAQNTGK